MGFFQLKKGLMIKFVEGVATYWIPKGARYVLIQIDRVFILAARGV